MKKPQSAYLGDFEVAVLLALVRLGADAYGMVIRRDLAARTGLDVSIGSVYTTLYRLEAKGYVTSSLGDTSIDRGNRAKRFFAVEARGLEALRETKARVDATWEGFPLRLPIVVKTSDRKVEGTVGLSTA